MAEISKPFLFLLKSTTSENEKKTIQHDYGVLFSFLLCFFRDNVKAELEQINFTNLHGTKSKLRHVYICNYNRWIALLLQILKFIKSIYYSCVHNLLVLNQTGIMNFVNITCGLMVIPATAAENKCQF